MTDDPGDEPGARRRALTYEGRAAALMRVAGWSVKASYLVGGLFGFYVIAGLVSSHYPDPWRGGNGAKIAGATAAWHAAVIAVAAYVSLYRLVPLVLLLGASRALERAEAERTREQVEP